LSTPPSRTALKKPVRLDRMAGAPAATGDSRSRGDRVGDERVFAVIRHDPSALAVPAGLLG
jgi:hypothetical protein